MTNTRWTEADFESLSWHDNHVYGLSIREGAYGSGRLVLDLDYITEWRCGLDKRCSFLLAPAELAFAVSRWGRSRSARFAERRLSKRSGSGDTVGGSY